MAQILKVAAKPTFKAPVVLMVAGDGGTFEEALRFTAHFKRLKGTEFDEVQAEMNARTFTDRDLVDKVLVGWDGLEDEEGVPFVFTEENRGTAREEWPTLESAIALSWLKHHDGAAVKNSGAPLASF